MSTIYVLEPPTKGKVVLNTTHGPLDIELWPKEAPKAVRNFVQLCLEGYYNHTIFHRIIKAFLVQAGDPTGTGTGTLSLSLSLSLFSNFRVSYSQSRFLEMIWFNFSGGESIYGGPFGDEFHSRLRFKHRGLVACANAGSPNSNGSQFFISLDRCDWLDKKNTIFGKVFFSSLFWNFLFLSIFSKIWIQLVCFRSPGIRYIIWLDYLKLKLIRMTGPWIHPRFYPLRSVESNKHTYIHTYC